MALSPATVTITALDDIPLVRPGDDLGGLLIAALDRAGLAPRPFDVLVVAQKIVSKAEGRLLDLSTVTPSPRAQDIAAIAGKDARLVEAILQESAEVLRVKQGVIIVATRGGLVMANAGIDRSNLEEEDHEKRVLLLPADPDRSAERLKARLDAHYVTDIGVIISDSVGRAWRLGAVGLAIGAAGVPALQDRRGEPDLSGRLLEVTEVGFADAVAASAVLVMGEAAEGRPAALVRGLDWKQEPSPASALVRPKSQDLFR
ncbi:coenzyme F420-0 gamma-glutamyl ligase [Rhizobiales bacterium GAS191]|jgi:coenzyme F420-0:L-glutamate ligase/coenzyme F420-1:gamma-L-glutamate ligase|nr:coenzyme F420-0 gamma-glutamyl ligase [Rhizobiales bacterium GAS113]SED75656.1 coenzyme F420-0 gamma-glutamyl ligase [Rhizobiales bacterium GAS188]SEE79149.1 coenzyme F420-0 gamma-glutamyl ligase [Rhizobiales bacterium GAS191]